MLSQEAVLRFSKLCWYIVIASSQEVVLNPLVYEPSSILFNRFID